MVVVIILIFLIIKLNINLILKEIKIEKIFFSIIHCYYEIDFTKISENDKNYLLNLESKVNEQYNILLSDIKSDDKTKNIKFKYILDSLITFDIKYKFEDLEILRNILATRKNLKIYEKEYNIIYAYAYFLVLNSLKNMEIGFTDYSIFLNLLNDLKKHIPKSFDIIRIIIWYNDNFLWNGQIEKKIYKLSKKEKIDITDKNQIKKLNEFSLIYPNQCQENTPYKICYEFLLKFIDELNEDSYLFETLYLLSSGIAFNKLYKNVSLFKLSLFNLSQIKQNLICHIPDVIIRKFRSENDKYEGIFLPNYGVMECYEGTLYGINDISLISKIINEEDKECKYTIPLIELFINELFGQMQLKFDKNYLMLPSHYYNPYDNYKLCCNNNFGKNGLFEFYISNDVEIIKYLKYGLLENKELLNAKLWTAKDLNELRFIVKKKIYYNKFKCQKVVNYFLDGKEDKYLILATGKKDEEFSDEQFNEEYNIYGFNRHNFYQYNFFQCIKRFDCI